MPKNEEQVNNKPSIWFLDPTGETKGGRPEYKEGEKWIMDYQSRTGTIPTVEEYNAWKTGQDVSGFHFSPESTMGRLGWGGRTMGDVRRSQGATYGPELGELVPSNAMVFTDQYGNPLFRSNQIYDIHGGYLNRGQYMEPPGGFDPWQQTQMMNLGITPQRGYMGEYGTYRAAPDVYTPREFQGRTIEEFTGQPTYDIYNAQLQDYLTRRQGEDYQAVKELQNNIQSQQSWYESRINDLNEKVNSGEIDQEYAEQMAAEVERVAIGTIEYYQNQLNDLMTQNKANQLLGEAQNMIELGLPFEELPLYQDVQGMTTGSNFMNLYNQMIEQEKTGFEAGEAERKGQIETRQELSKPPTVQRKYQPSERDIYDYQAYVSSLPMAKEWEDWLYNKFNENYTDWIHSGMTESFISWLSNYLAGEF